MQHLIEAFRQNLQFALEKAKQSDEILETLSEQNMGKFTAIFPKEAGFNTQANRMTPYVEEVAMRFYDETQNGAKLVVHPQALAELAELLEKIFTLQQQLEQTVNTSGENS